MAATYTSTHSIEILERKQKLSIFEKKFLLLLCEHGYLFSYWQKKEILLIKPYTSFRYKLNYIYYYFEYLKQHRQRGAGDKIPFISSNLNHAVSNFRSVSDTQESSRMVHSIHFNFNDGLRTFNSLKLFVTKRKPLYVSVSELKLLSKGSQSRYPTHTLILETSKGLYSHIDAKRLNLGGRLVALIS